MIHAFETPFGGFTLTVANGIVRTLQFGLATPDAVADPRAGAVPENAGDVALSEEAEAQLRAYFAGKRKRFNLPLAPAFAFNRRVWLALQGIPFGQTRTYGEIAAACGNPGAARAVGNACGSNPVPVIVPCHRAVAANGLGGFSSGLDIKKRLLNLERYALPGYWKDWKPQDDCVLMFIRVAGKILLIVKKRGLGQGKVNAPGGHIEPGETPLEAAIRETREEVGVTPLNPVSRGVLRFAFLDGYTERCEVFEAKACTGTPVSSPEADPFWCDETAIPFDRMWADDRYWLPSLLAGGRIRARFVFDGDRLLWR